MRYFLDCDDDGHWYVVPVDREAYWSSWMALDRYDPKAWEAPDFAAQVGGSYTLVEFDNPSISGEVIERHNAVSWRQRG